MIRVGLVGYGLAGKVFHAPFVTAVEGLELAAIVERSSRNAEAAYPGITTYPTLEAMLSDQSLELIVIGTPNSTHVPLATEALKAGRHVVVDKPVAATSAELTDLISLATAQGKFLIPFHNRRWDSDFQTLHKLIHEGSVGDVVSLESTFDRWRPLRTTGSWKEVGGYGNGLLLDIGTHVVDQALVLFGQPEAVSAEILTERQGSKANDSFTIRLHYPGKVVTVSANCLSAFPKPRFTLRGTKGGFLKWGLDPQETLLKANYRAITTGGSNWAEEPAAKWGTLNIDAGDEHNTVVTHPVKPVPSDYRQYYAGVRDAIRGKSAPPVLATEALEVAKILEYAEQSAVKQQAIACK